MADTFTRTSCAVLPRDDLFMLHESLCHPGITRMNHFIRSRNLAYSIDDVQKMTLNCHVCNTVKPRYHKAANLHLIKATQPFDRLSIDFKGPLPSVTQNKYILTIVNEYSRFPFADPC